MMKRLKFRLSKLLLALLLVPLLVFGQGPSEQEVQLFKTYFYDSLAVGIDFRTLAVLNRKLKAVERNTARKSFTNKSFSRLKLKPEFNVIQIQTITGNNWKKEIPVYADTTVNQDLFSLYWGVHSTDERPLAYGMKVKRERMKQYVKAFKSQATTLPLFYTIIDKAYGGDIDAYVDDLFDHSIFATSGNLTRYRNYSLSSLRLRIDPLVTYAICCAQYVKKPAPHSRTGVLKELTNFMPKNSPSSDKELFRSYFMDSIWMKIDLITMNNVYTFKKKDDNFYHMWTVDQDSEWGVHFKPTTWWPRGFQEDLYADGHLFDSRYLSMLEDMFYRLHLGFNETQDKARMKRFIKDFRSKATRLPTFYQYIDRRFKGNSDAYVDYLFENSLFTNQKKFLRLKKWLKRRTLSRDPMVKYALSVMQYLYCV